MLLNLLTPNVCLHFVEMYICPSFTITYDFS